MWIRLAEIVEYVKSFSIIPCRLPSLVDSILDLNETPVFFPIKRWTLTLYWLYHQRDSILKEEIP